MDESPTPDEAATRESASSQAGNSPPGAYEDRIEKVEAENAALRERIDSLEARLAEDEADTAASERHSVASVSRRGALASILGLGGLSLATPASANQRNAGRYLGLSQGTYNFTGPAEWENEGQFTNTASGKGATVGGGKDNEASGDRAVVSGGGEGDLGEGNLASGGVSAIGGGEDNEATAPWTTVGGGLGNRATKHFAATGGGVGNDALGFYGTVGGGNQNTVIGRWTTVAGGGGNKVYDDYGTIAGGDSNQAGTDNDESDATHATVGGGEENEATAEDATVGGGSDNKATKQNSTVGGGHHNMAGGLEPGGNFSTVDGGKNNRAVGFSSAVGGGSDNGARAQFSTVGGGYNNDVYGDFATLPGGLNNRATGDYAFATGRLARADHDGAVVIGDSTGAAISSSSRDEMCIQQDLKAKSVSKEEAAAKMTLSFSQTIPADKSEHKIEFDKKQFDHFGWADASNHEFSVPGPATLLVGVNPAWKVIGTDDMYVFEIRENGDSLAIKEKFHAEHGSAPTHYMSMVTQVPEGTTKTFSVMVKQFGDESHELNPGKGHNEFWVIKQG